MNLKNWISNLFNANNRTHTLAVIGIIIGALQKSQGVRDFELTHGWLSVLMGVAGYLYTTYNHPTETSAAAEPVASSNMGKTFGVLILCIALSSFMVVGMTGCSNWDQNTYASLSADKATILGIADDIVKGAIPNTPSITEPLKHARDVHDNLVAAFTDYVTAKFIQKLSGPALASKQQLVIDLLANSHQTVVSIQQTVADFKGGKSTSDNTITNPIPGKPDESVGAAGTNTASYSASVNRIAEREGNLGTASSASCRSLSGSHSVFGPWNRGGSGLRDAISACIGGLSIKGDLRLPRSAGSATDSGKRASSPDRKAGLREVGAGQ